MRGELTAANRGRQWALLRGKHCHLQGESPGTASQRLQDFAIAPGPVFPALHPHQLPRPRTKLLIWQTVPPVLVLFPKSFCPSQFTAFFSLQPVCYNGDYRSPLGNMPFNGGLLQTLASLERWRDGWPFGDSFQPFIQITDCLWPRGPCKETQRSKGGSHSSKTASP